MGRGTKRKEESWVARGGRLWSEREKEKNTT